MRFTDLRAQAWRGSWLGTLPAVRALAGAPEAELGALKAWALAENDTGPESAALEDAVAGPQIRLVCSTRQLELLEAGGRERIISGGAE